MSIEAKEEFRPKIVAFCCNWCSYAGADLAGSSRLSYPAVGAAALERKNAGFTAIKMNATEELQMIDTYDKVDAVLERVAAIRETVTIQQEIIMQEDV